jgi:2-dehydro-3-deoxyphosphogluconate aldolase/(4S)-4-hydroxy-2-oxoglutarate aldolase
MLGAIASVGVVPVVTLNDPDDAAPLVDALCGGGLAVVEITLRTAAGLDAIARVARGDGDAIVGAGSIRNVDEAKSAIDSGAEFLVSPGLDEDLVRWADDHGVAAVPGIATATELLRARALGVDVVKLFPAETAGGAATVAALAAVFPDVRFLPTGGITPANAADYLRLPEVIAIGGSWMVPKSMIDGHDWASITRSARTAVDLVEAIR